MCTQRYKGSYEIRCSLACSARTVYQTRKLLDLHQRLPAFKSFFYNSTASESDADYVDWFAGSHWYTHTERVNHSRSSTDSVLFQIRLLLESLAIKGSRAGALSVSPALATFGLVSFLNDSEYDRSTMRPIIEFAGQALKKVRSPFWLCSAFKLIIRRVFWCVRTSKRGEDLRQSVKHSIHHLFIFWMDSSVFIY